MSLWLGSLVGSWNSHIGGEGGPLIEPPLEPQAYPEGTWSFTTGGTSWHHAP
jgi:hypothetical protein